MPIELEDRACENGTYGIRCTFVEKTPEGNVPFTPKSGLKWSIRDKHGNDIRVDVPMTPAQTVYIVLTDTDLALAGGPAMRYVTVECTYDGILGNDLPFVEEISFKIDNLVGKP